MSASGNQVDQTSPKPSVPTSRVEAQSPDHARPNVLDDIMERIRQYEIQASQESVVVMDANNKRHAMRMEQERNKLIEIGALCMFTLIALFIVLNFICKNPKFNPDNVIHAAGLIFTICGTIIIVIMANTEEQLTASMGIIGAVAGYLFGVQRRSAETERESEKATGSEVMIEDRLG